MHDGVNEREFKPDGVIRKRVLRIERMLVSLLEDQKLTARNVGPGDSHVKVVALSECPSTNDLCHELLTRDDCPSPLLLVAERQTAGRGRLDRSFFSSDRGGLYMSLLLRPDGETFGERQPDLNLITAAAGVVACRAIEEVTGEWVGIEWVNDLIYRGGKLGGILTESRWSGSGGLIGLVVGIGINIADDEILFPPWLKDIAVTLKVGEDAELTRLRIIAKITAGLLNLWRGQHWRSVLAEYRQRSTLIDKLVRVTPVLGEPYRAKVVRIDDRGGLIVRSEHGVELSLENEDVSIL